MIHLLDNTWRTMDRRGKLTSCNLLLRNWCWGLTERRRSRWLFFSHRTWRQYDDDDKHQHHMPVACLAVYQLTEVLWFPLLLLRSSLEVRVGGGGAGGVVDGRCENFIITNLHLSVGVRINFLFLYFTRERERERVKPVALGNNTTPIIKQSTLASHLCLTEYLQNISNNRLYPPHRSLLDNISIWSYTHSTTV